MKGGVISCPPDYMFIDWARIDGFDLHHPPMALGQTALNAFYQRALTDAAELYSVSGDGKKAAVCEKKANRHRKNCRVRFYNRYLGVYGDGGSAPEYVYPPTTWLPENPEKAYHSRHANILAVWSGLITGGAADSLLRRILTEDTLDGYTDIDIQPYFMHYLLEIVRETRDVPRVRTAPDTYVGQAAERFAKGSEGRLERSLWGTTVTRGEAPRRGSSLWRSAGSECLSRGSRGSVCPRRFWGSDRCTWRYRRRTDL